jgi:hypothetical protein
MPLAARDPSEQQPVGRAGADIEIVYDLLAGGLPGLEELIDLIQSLPVSIDQFRVFVRPAVGTTFASQFDIVFSEGVYRNDAGEFARECTLSGILEKQSVARVVFPNAVAAHAFFEIVVGLDFVMSVELPFLGNVKLIDLHPADEIGALGVKETVFSSGNAVGIAESKFAIDPPGGMPVPDPAGFAYGGFRKFSNESPIDGASFVDACLADPPPVDQPLPEPSYTAGDPDDLLQQNVFPCNLCVAFGREYEACILDDDTLSPEEREVRVDECFFDEDGVCRHESGTPGLCRIEPVDMRSLGIPEMSRSLFRVAQPAGKEWSCDAPQKNGCFDLCTYDPENPDVLMFFQSAMDLEEDSVCDDYLPLPGGCTFDAECDDSNPCTVDECLFEFGCNHRAVDMEGESCDDGLFCTGSGVCHAGICEAAGNPCSASGLVCDERSDSCESGLSVCGDNDVNHSAEQCDGDDDAACPGECLPPGSPRECLCPNHPPVADAGDDRTVECTSPGGADVTLDGSASSDPDGDVLSYEWANEFGTRSGVEVTVPLTIGVHAIGLAVDDGNGGVDSDEVVIDVLDSTPPMIACNAPETIVPRDAPVTFTATAADTCDTVNPIPEVINYRCYENKRHARTVNKDQSCIVSIDGDGISIIDSGGRGTHIVWTAQAVDSAGNRQEQECEVFVERP